MPKYKSEQEVLANYDPSKKHVLPKGYTADMAVFTLIANEEYDKLELNPEGLSKKELDAKKETTSKHKLALMLIQRAELDSEGEINIEHGKWALPGGFTQYHEDKGSAYTAAIRELQEETEVTGLYLKHFGVYDKKGRDPRGWIISNAHYAIVPEKYIQNRKANDDAQKVELYTIEEVFQLDLAFDHREIITDAIKAVEDDMFETTVAKNFLPKEFKLQELRQVLLAVIDDNVVKSQAAFFRKAPTLPFIEEVLDKNGEPKTTDPTGTNKRPSQLYRFIDVKVRASIWS